MVLATKQNVHNQKSPKSKNEQGTTSPKSASRSVSKSRSKIVSTFADLYQKRLYITRSSIASSMFLAQESLNQSTLDKELAGFTLSLEDNPLRSRAILKDTLDHLPPQLQDWFARWTDHRGTDVLQLCIIYDKAELVNLILENEELFPNDYVPAKCNPYAHLAAVLGYCDVLEVLLTRRPGFYFKTSKSHHTIKIHKDFLVRTRFKEGTGHINKYVQKLLNKVIDRNASMDNSWDGTVGENESKLDMELHELLDKSKPPAPSRKAISRMNAVTFDNLPVKPTEKRTATSGPASGTSLNANVLKNKSVVVLEAPKLKRGDHHIFVHPDADFYFDEKPEGVVKGAGPAVRVVGKDDVIGFVQKTSIKLPKLEDVRLLKQRSKVAVARKKTSASSNNAPSTTKLKSEMSQDAMFRKSKKDLSDSSYNSSAVVGSEERKPNESVPQHRSMVGFVEDPTPQRTTSSYTHNNNSGGLSVPHSNHQNDGSDNNNANTDTHKPTPSHNSGAAIRTKIVFDNNSFTSTSSGTSTNSGGSGGGGGGHRNRTTGGHNNHFVGRHSSASRASSSTGTFKKIELGIRTIKKYKAFKVKIDTRVLKFKDNRYDSKTPLTMAAERGHIECVKYILQRFLQSHTKRQAQAADPLTLATRAESPEAVAALLTTKYTQSDYQSAILTALREYYPACLTILLSTDTKERELLFDGENLFHIMFSQSLTSDYRYDLMPEMTRTLIGCKEPVNAKNPNNYHPLYTVISCAFNIQASKQIVFYLECLKILLHARANPHYNELKMKTNEARRTLLVSRPLYYSAVHCVLACAERSRDRMERPLWSKVIMQKFIDCIVVSDRTARRVLNEVLFSYMDHVCLLGGLDARVLRSLFRYGANPDFMVEEKFAINRFFDAMLPFLTQFEVVEAGKAQEDMLDALMMITYHMTQGCLQRAFSVFLRDHLLRCPIQALPLVHRFCHAVDDDTKTPRSLARLSASFIWRELKRNSSNARRLPVDDKLFHMILPY